jgi:hypothetical protein
VSNKAFSPSLSAACSTDKYPQNQSGSARGNASELTFLHCFEVFWIFLSIRRFSFQELELSRLIRGHFYILLPMLSFSFSGSPNGLLCYRLTL